MAIATQSVSATAIARSSSTAATSYTIVSGLTISAGSGLRLRLMACISRSEISKYSDLPTWNGVALSMIGTPTTGGSGEYVVHWELIAPAPGTGNLIITNSSNTNDGTFWYIVETGTDANSATGYALENNSATSGSPSATVPAGASAIVCGASFAYTTASPGVLSGTTQIGTNESHRYCGQRIGAAPGVGTWASANQVAAFTSVVGAAASSSFAAGPTAEDATVGGTFQSSNSAMGAGPTAEDAPVGGSFSRVPGTFSFGPIERNDTAGVTSVPLTWITFLASATGAAVLTRTDVSINGAGLIAGSDVALVPGQAYQVTWRESGGQYGSYQFTAA